MWLMFHLDCVYANHSVGINSVQLMGRVGADPQVVSGETNGVDWSFVQFPLATNEPRYIQSEDSELNLYAVMSALY